VYRLAITFHHPAQHFQDAHHEEHPYCHLRFLRCGSEPAVPDPKLGEDTTNYTYKSLAAGRFTLDWVLGPGGNFVAGKGYKGSPNLFVPYLI
jgi:hypothetical protein